MKRFFLFLIVFSFATFGYSQSELGITGGGMYYMGDLNPNLLTGKTHLSGGIVYRYRLNARWAIKSNLLYGMISDDDLDHGDPYDRGLNFRSRMWELAAQAELNFFKFGLGYKKYWFTPYMSFGAGLLHFNPQSQYTMPSTGYTDWVDLHELNTEGQGYPKGEGGIDNYSLVQLVLPVGFGFKFALGNMMCLSLEWAYRITFTDYLDDVSGVYFNNDILKADWPKAAFMADPTQSKATGMQRGDKSTKDAYAYFGATLTFNLNPTKACHGVRNYD